MQRIKQTMENARVERERRLREWTHAAPATADIIPVVPAASTVSSTPVAVLSDDTAMLFARTQVASLDKSKLRGNRLLLPGVIGEAAYAFKMLRTQVLQRLQQHGWNTLAVVSPAPGDGKTFTAINLAIAISGDSNVTSLLVDLDLRRPGVHKRLGIEPSVGVSQVLRGEAELSDALVNPEGYERLLVLPAGQDSVQNSSELLSTSRARRVFRDIKQGCRNRIVIYDLPPVLGADDALSFMPQVDAALVVISDGQTRRDDVLHLFELFSNVTVIGTVLNGVRADRSRAYAY
jgi:protein-tyrosine kinase